MPCSRRSRAGPTGSKRCAGRRRRGRSKVFRSFPRQRESRGANEGALATRSLHPPLQGEGRRAKRGGVGCAALKKIHPLPPAFAALRPATSPLQGEVKKARARTIHACRAFAGVASRRETALNG